MLTYFLFRGATALAAGMHYVHIQRKYSNVLPTALPIVEKRYAMLVNIRFHKDIVLITSRWYYSGRMKMQHRQGYL